MDPITLILTALNGGASQRQYETVGGAYNKLKILIQEKFVGKPNADLVLTEYEHDPQTWEAPLVKFLAQVQADQDEEIIEVAQKLMSQLDPQQAAIGKYNIQVSGNAQMQRFVIGDHNSVFFQEFKARETDRVSLILAQNLRLESFNLGDDTAANFPYITTPIQDSYLIATQALQDAGYSTKEAKRGVLIFGETNAGKTRLAVEVLKKTLPEWLVLQWSPVYTIQMAPTQESLINRSVVVFIEDIQKYIPNVEHQISPFISNVNVETLRALIKMVRESADHMVTIVTCRVENERQVRAEFSEFFDELMLIRLPRFSADAKNTKTAQIISEFKRKGAKHAEDWDGTLGSLVLGLSRKRSLYDSLVMNGDPAASVLRAMKLLAKLVSIEQTERRIQTICARVFGEKSLKEDIKIWHAVIERLTQLQFIREEMLLQSKEMLLIIRKDSYFEQVITDYPNPDRPDQIKRDLVSLRNAFVEIKDAGALNILAMVLGLEGLFDEAVAACDDAIAFDPNNFSLWFSKGASLALWGIFEEGLKAFDRALLINPNYTHAWWFKGRMLRALKRHAEAIEAYDLLLTLDPNYYEAWSDKGVSLLALGRSDEALAAVNRAVNIGSDKVNAWYIKAVVLNRTKHYGEALTACNHVLALDPDGSRMQALDLGASRLWTLKGEVLLKLGRKNEAAAAFDHALTIDPMSANAWFEKAAFLSRCGLFQEAITAFDRVLELDPQNSKAWFIKALSHEGLRQGKEAAIAVDRALELDPQNAVAWRYKGHLLALLRQFDKALIALDRALTLDQKDTEAWVLKGHIHNKMQQFEIAAFAFDQALILDPKNAEIWFQKGRMSVLLNQREEAVAAFDHVLALEPNHALAKEFKQKVLELWDQFK